MKPFLLLQSSVAMLCLLAILACSESRAMRSANSSGPQHADYVVFGSWVLCASMDSHCLEERFNRCLGQTRKEHVRDNGRPHKLTLLSTGDAIAEWELRASGDRVIITYDHQGIAREWSYEGSWGVLHGKSIPDEPPRRPQLTLLSPVSRIVKTDGQRAHATLILLDISPPSSGNLSNARSLLIC